jgi:hypothetical protein
MLLFSKLFSHHRLDPDHSALMDSDSGEQELPNQGYTFRTFWCIRLVTFILTTLLSLMGPGILTMEILNYGKSWVYDYDKYQGQPDEVHVMNFDRRNPESTLYCTGNYARFPFAITDNSQIVNLSVKRLHPRLSTTML